MPLTGEQNRKITELINKTEKLTKDGLEAVMLLEAAKTQYIRTMNISDITRGEHLEK